VVRWFGTNTDITTQRKTEEELRRMNRELEEFSYVAGHDLREPLRMLNLYTELLVKKLGGADGECGTYAGVIRQCVSRMDALLRDLLTFSHAVHSEEQPGGTADLAGSLNEALTMLQGQIAETGAIIEAEALPVVRGDTSQMAHVFQNLLSNAMKYRGQDVPVKIRISVQPDGDRWTVSVKDNGIGFEPRYADHIFGLFKRLHNREFPGTGLGLAICKRIVERYGGRIWAESSLGEGASFKISLPRIT
jgi:light-regulated signal transduction histidine kinase (bacteriophytochrome)